ncbi:hypothetical protein SCP_0505880 [Sparassis crispa]|uniref:Uncharacterized protein n=1 Tax=Sparassis crispa TaxID=139825 RepID=A0A401GP50_9APHY|nr:hypothetical protein SCP_0505880 [Sparassis crispa]GBE83534.1 hypothetical protein SCP_0505880 [Sparassis crispa]
MTLEGVHDDPCLFGGEYYRQEDSGISNSVSVTEYHRCLTAAALHLLTDGADISFSIIPATRCGPGAISSPSTRSSLPLRCQDLEFVSAGSGYAGRYV